MADEAGKVRIDGDEATLVFERRLRHPPERVWRALTSPDELSRWMMATATLDGHAGGEISMVTGPAQFHWTGRILAWEPFARLEYEMNTPPHAHLPLGEQSVVRYRLEPLDDGTLLRLEHSRLSRPTALGFAPGTHAFLDRLEALLDDAALPGWMHRYEEVKGLYPQWEAERS